MCHGPEGFASPSWHDRAQWKWSGGKKHANDDLSVEDVLCLHAVPGDSTAMPYSGARRAEAVSVEAGLAAARTSATEALDQDSVGWRILRKQGWTQGVGLGPKGTGLTRPITDHLKAGETLYAHVEGAGVALPAESYRLENTPVTDWKKGSTTDRTRWEDLTAFFVRVGTLDDLRKATVVMTPEPAQVFSEHVDSWSDEIVLTHKGTGKQERVRSDADAQTLKRTWAKAQERDLELDRASLSPDHFFACCNVPASVQLLCVETTGEVFESTVEVTESVAAGRALKQALERRLRGSVRVLCLRHVILAQDGGECDDGDGVGDESSLLERGADRRSTLQPAPGPAGSEEHPERTQLSTPCELSAQNLAVLGRGFHRPAPEGDEESLSVPPSEASVNLGHHARERLADRSITRKEIWQAKTRGRLFLSIEQKRGQGDPEQTTYQLNCKREALKEWGRFLMQRFPNIVAAEPVERGGGIHKRVEMRLDGSDGLGDEVKRLLKARGFLDPPLRCNRCDDKHVNRVKYEDTALRAENDTLVVVEGFVGKPRLAGGVVTTYLKPPKQQARRGEARSQKQRLSIFAVTSKTTCASSKDSDFNAEASRLLGLDMFGQVYLLCRRDLKTVCDYPLSNFLRDFQPNP